MGHSSSKPSSPTKGSPSKDSPTKDEKQTKHAAPITNYNPNYDVVKKYDDPHYGEVGLVKEHLTSTEMLCKRIVANSKEAYEAELRVCEQRGAFTNSNVVRVIGYNHEEQKNFCANFHNITVFIEHYEKTLLDKIREAAANSTHLSESELLIIAENLISCLAYFQDHGVNHGDIRPFNIFVGVDSYKLSDPTLAPQKNYNAYLAALIGGHKTLIAPEYLKHLAEKEEDVKLDSKFDVFSLGATLLAAATLTNSEDLYNYERGLLNEKLLDERLEQVRTRYSDFTFDLIRDMLYLDETKRPDFAALEARINPHKEKIHSRTPLFENQSTGSEYEDILKRVAEQLARSQQLRESIEKGTYNFSEPVTQDKPVSPEKEVSHEHHEEASS